MTGSNDLDRMLASYLEEGPRRAPDRAMDAALTFAAAHPRRRDPLLFLKPEVMARRSSMFSPQLAWAALVAVLALGAVAAIAIGTRPSVSSRSCRRRSVESPSPSSDRRRQARRRRRSASSSRTSTGSTILSTSSTSPGALVAVDPGPAYTGPEIGEAAASTDPESDTRLFVTWAFTGCNDPTSITVDETALAVAR